jgi:hypothetical protein
LRGNRSRDDHRREEQDVSEAWDDADLPADVDDDDPDDDDDWGEPGDDDDE